MKKNTHEGKINLVVSCIDPDDSCYGTSENFDPEDAELLNLKPGDRVLYKIPKDKDIEITGRIHIKKTIEKLN